VKKTAAYILLRERQELETVRHIDTFEFVRTVQFVVVPGKPVRGPTGQRMKAASLAFA
jgi:hypothetical protein